MTTTQIPSEATMRDDDSSSITPVGLAQPCDGKNCDMTSVILEMRDMLIEMRSEQRHQRHALKELQEDKKRVIWGALAFLGSVIAGVIVWAVKQGATPTCLIVGSLVLAGCVTSNRQENAATIKTEERVGIEAGQPTQLTVTTREQTTTQAHTDSGVDVAKAITAAMAGFKGDFLTALAQLKPAEPQATGIDGLTGGIGAAAASLGLIALREFMARRKAQQDADDEWRRANDSHAREVELAKQLPPKGA